MRKATITPSTFNNQYESFSYDLFLIFDDEIIKSEQDITMARAAFLATCWIEEGSLISILVKSKDFPCAPVK